ncbi:MAG: VanZ family protein [Phycisphaerae bacterium]|nr:VanZ family protein [Phycisphaerae bacterium]
MTHRASIIIRLLAKILCGVVWIAAAVATHLPSETYADISAGDYELHFFGYLILTGVFLVTLRLHGVRWRKRALLALPILLLYAALDEWTQNFVGRCGAFSDGCANAVGILTALVLDGGLTLLSRLRRRR